ncbi:DoxX family protein [Winogradskyella immobilis]|uniref:DoxX family membrane protein n=1 Tax=Winogradskyella immobilis TaxID=2816852 RepID=A0ABS8EPJ8_9FLAO|nr:DoxX family protein [Winogradskyella immobilis]MCC1485139.1 DoxX family membrane protein [Winogradskyella immobilis]MCG0017231.1 DoxX family protein [Winogradskyella immobilis]
MNDLLNATTSAQIITLLFLTILFIQSGLDKVFNYKGNYEYFKSHFAKSILKNTIGILLPVITLLEVAAGICSLIGVVQIIINGSTTIGLIGAQLSALSILALFFGQRVANEYEGSSTLVGYFLVTIVSIFLLG